MDTKSIGFDADLGVRKREDVGQVLREVLPEDLVKYGLIPEFVGRVPIVVTLDGLNREALVRILKEPKNSLVRQYTKLLELDGVDLTFDEDALTAMAEEALARKTGARGLRSIMEKTMMDVMYRIPSDNTIRSCEITRDSVEANGDPVVTHGEPRPVLRRNMKTRHLRSTNPETA
jgi:ATP-dependent Clp protease ATP-binding subunit ClpX